MNSGLPATPPGSLLYDRRAPVPALIVCPRCEGQQYDRGSCQMCANTGYLREDGARLAHVERMQIVATFALALDLELSVATPEQIAGRRGA